ncbi:membrane protein [Helicobacter pylori PZ5086]|nr:membrane protein [Helicobacter pylori PZ5086]
MKDWVGLRFFVCFVLKMVQNLFCFITFRFLALAALSAYICSRGLKILGFWVFQ